MDGFVKTTGAVSQRGGGNHADGAGNHGGLVRENVAEHVFRDDYVKLTGILDNLHGAVVYQHVGQLHVRIFRRQLVHDLLPQTGRIQHVALFHAAQLVIALSGSLKADAADPADFAFGVAQLVNGNGLPVFGDGFVLAEVDAADELPDNEKVDAPLYNLRLQGRGGGQLRPDFRRAVVAVDPHADTQPEKPLFGPLGAGNAVPLGAANRTQKDGIGGQAFIQHFLGQRVAVAVDGIAAHGNLGIGKFMAEDFGNPVKNGLGLGYNFRADAVAGNQCDVFRHFITSPSRMQAGRPFL